MSKNIHTFLQSINVFRRGRKERRTLGTVLVQDFYQATGEKSRSLSRGKGARGHTPTEAFNATRKE